MKTVFAVLAAGWLAAGAAAAADRCGDPACGGQAPAYCSQCGARKVCRVVREMQEVKKTCWVVECEEFCAPLPRFGKSDCGGAVGCGDAGRGGPCGGCKENDVCQSLRERPLVPPKCGKVRCRKHLVKKEITCLVPVYQCVMVPSCNCQTGGCREPAAGH